MQIKSMERIDAHLHVCGGHPRVTRVLEKFDMKLLNICVAHAKGEDWRRCAEQYKQRVAESPRRYAWCTTFDVPDFEDPHYADKAIEGLRRDFDAGAVACKVWKNIGMDVKDPGGQFIQLDHPILRPIFDYLEGERRTVVMHIGEPLACWRPLTPENPHYGYYSKHPQWHMFGRDDMPAHETIIAARDRVLQRHPKMPSVGAHLGSLEFDVDEVAKRLDAFDNFVVDTSARAVDLAVQDTEKVRAFMDKYRDRVLFATDIVARDDAAVISPEQLDALVAKLTRVYSEELAFYESGRQLTLYGRTVTGLALDDAILEKFYRANARKWFPGI